MEALVKTSRSAPQAASRSCQVESDGASTFLLGEAPLGYPSREFGTPEWRNWQTQGT
jgi:hypothetical protein